VSCDLFETVQKPINDCHVQSDRGTWCLLLQALHGRCELWQPIHRNFYASEDNRQAGAKLLAMYVKRCANKWHM
jgi:hypothetical protein